MTGTDPMSDSGLRMLVPSMTTRPEQDRCPGVLRPFSAGDGALVRLRLPGGLVQSHVLLQLSYTASIFGSSVLQLTSRGNLQLRGLPDPLPQEFITRVVELGLLPSSTHERVRNIVASPFDPTLQVLSAQLDRALCAEPLLAALPGRFLFVFADAQGHGLAERYDVAYQAMAPDFGWLWVAGYRRPVSADDAVTAMLGVARYFLHNRTSSRCWQTRELPVSSDIFANMMKSTEPIVILPEPGPVAGQVVVGVPLGLLQQRQTEALAATTAEVVVTPWRSVVLPESATLKELIAVGLLTVAESAHVSVHRTARGLESIPRRSPVR